MTRMRKFCFIICSYFLLLSSTSAVEADLQIRHATGGQATALVIDGNYWYQALGERLLVLHKNGGEHISTVALAEQATALCIDLLVDGTTLYALLDGIEVIVLDIGNPKAPKITRRIAAEELDILPRRLVSVNKVPSAVGDGGVARLTDGKNIVDCDCEVTGAAWSAELGIVYTAGENIYDRDSGELIGIASELFELDESANADLGTLVYARALGSETEVGLMTAMLKNLDSSLSRETLDGELTHIFIRGSRVFVTTTMGIYVLGIAPKELRLLRTFHIDNVRSIGVVASNYLAVSGNFGRGLFRITEDNGGMAETLFRVVSANGKFAAGHFDLRGVHVPTEVGSMMYLFDEPIVASKERVSQAQVNKNAIVLGGEACIDTQNGNVTIAASSSDSQLQLSSPARTVVANKGNFWFGTNDGISVVQKSSNGTFDVQESIRLAGPIVQLIPLLDGGVAFVSEAGFVGIVEERQDEVALEQ